MKAFSKVLLAGLLIGGASAPAFAQITASANAGASITVIRPITIVADTALAFGTVTRAAGTVTINETTGARSVSGVIAVPGTTTRAQFTVGGEGGQNFTLAVPTSVTLNGPSSSTLSITTAQTAANGTQQLSGSLGSAGTFVFGVGGTITLTGSTTTGAYTGSITAQVDYQ